ncbi:MAG TPA: GGDEF domain-containing protein [Candidatus Hydrogenedentes bacterium]|jgi:diguanylate cyclase (GGDEF)-like protein|nr:GGDEF domain-containing protein [Candidatus Hydrogenedentota bacterium]
MTLDAREQFAPEGSADAEEYKARLATRRLLDGMDIVAGAALSLQNPHDDESYPFHVVDVTLRAVSDLVDFNALGLAWFDSTGLEWKLGAHWPEAHRATLLEEIEHQIEHDFVGWAITQNKPVNVPALSREKRTFIHPLGTQRRIIGFFVGISNERYIPDVYQKLISILLTHCVNMLESHRLYAENLERRAEERRLYQLTLEDSLTGLANRRHFDEVLATELRRADRTRCPVSLLMIDIDCFKAYNDQYGHQGGDVALKQVAAAVAATVCRAGDLAARYGGEEFAAILPATDARGAAEVAERLRAAIEDLQILHERCSTGPYLTVSLGLSTVKEGPLDAVSLIASADRALYRAKRQGGNRLECESF